MKNAAMISMAAAVGAAKFGGASFDDAEAQSKFTAFVKKFNKSYAIGEVFDRFATFRKNLAMIASHDEGSEGWSMAMNEFADMSWDEFSTMFKGYNHRENEHSRSMNLHEVNHSETLAGDVDWVAKGAVTPPKNQGQCGSCWSFSTSGAVEGAWQIAKGELLSLSEQQMVDCAGSYGNNGCSGGLMDDGFEYVIKEGLATEESYPYTAKDGGACNTDAEKVAHISSYTDVAKGDEAALLSAVNQGPVSVAIQADQSGFQFYSGGVFSGTCGKQLDHGVLVVGYGADAGKEYWKIKNSWGATWGEQGFIRIARDQDQCGLADSASYPVV